MGKFKDYLMRESTGLGDLGTKIDSLFNSHWFGNAINGAVVSSKWNGSEASPDNGFYGYSLQTPNSDLTIPSVQRQGRITALLLKKNPIYVRLSDGTEANFSYDEWKRIQGTPQLGKVMTITFQRHPNDSSSQHSKIDMAVVTD